LAFSRALSIVLCTKTQREFKEEVDSVNSKTTNTTNSFHGLVALLLQVPALLMFIDA
jgi:hypothetical protein